jgi:sugar-specific transcriptional regulator TrmB
MIPYYMDSIKTILRSIGLTVGEIQVYLALLDIGSSSTGKITKQAEISSSKVYEVLQRLISKGLASYVIERGVKQYSATPAARLIDFLDDKQNEIESGKNAIRKFLPELEAKRKKKEFPEAIIYRGRRGALVALNEVIEAGKEGLEIVAYGTEDYPTYFPAQIKEYVKIAKKYAFKERLLFAQRFKSPNTNAKIRYIPKEYNIPVRTMIYGNKVAIVDFTEPMTTIILEKEQIAKSYLNHFNMMWNLAKR